MPVSYSASRARRLRNWDQTFIPKLFSRGLILYGDPIHVLSPEDLITYKAVFDRAKDWQDIASIVYAAPEPLDFGYVRDWLERIDAPEGRRLARLDRLIASGGRDLGA